MPAAGERDGLWALERGGDEWGFKTRSARFDKRARGQMVLVWQHLPEMVFLAALDFAAVGFVVVGLRRPPEGSAWRSALWIAGALARLAGCTAAVLVALFFVVVSGLTGSLCLVSLTAGAAALLLPRRFLRKRGTAAG